VIVVVTEEREVEVVPTHSSILPTQPPVGVKVCRGAAWKVIPEAEGGVEVETVIV
jgi:hypothetical protein